MDESSPKPVSRCRRILRVVLKTLAVCIVLLLLLAAGLWWYYHPDYQSTTDVVYGERGGKPLVLDIYRPDDANGVGIVFMVSGSWRSSDEAMNPWPAAPLLRDGYTIFCVRHVSQPEATVMETVEDVKRAVRFIRYHAEEYGVDPERLGVSGGSSGGHLSLMIATTGGPGDPAALDPVDRESSAVQAAAVFYPVTDLINLGDSRENLHDGGPPKSYVKAFGMESRAVEPWLPVGRAMSPIEHITPDLPPILIYHGTADTLVPYDQSTRFDDKAEVLGLEVEVIARPGKKHGWPTMLIDVFGIGDFYDEHLLN